MIDKIRRYHATYLGWISNYTSADPAVLKGAAEVQKAFGYRFVIDSLSYRASCQPGRDLSLRMTVRNTGSAPFYLNWPVAVALLDPQNRKPVWSAPLNGIDVRQWLPGEDWDSDAFAYGRGSNLSYTFFNHGKIAPGRYRFSCRVKGTTGLTVRFDVADGWRGVINPVTVPLSSEWREHEIEFEVTVAFENETRLRFGLPPDASGEFHLTDTHLRRTD